jgi:hypothetical protein
MKNKILEKIQSQPSSRNLSSKKVTASGALDPDKVISSIYKDEPISIVKKSSEIEDLIDSLSDEELKDLMSPESKKQSVGQISKEANEAYRKSSEFKTPEQLENIKKVDEVKQLREKIISDRMKKEAILAEKKAMETTRAAERLAESKSFNKPIGLKKAGKFGALASVLGLGTSLLAPDSKAAEVVEKIEEAASKADPATYLQEGISEFDKKFKEMQDEAKRKKLEKQLVESEVKKVVETTGGEPDIRPSKAEKMAGEKESGDIEDMSKIINYEDYLNQRKRKFGY